MVANMLLATKLATFGDSSMANQSKTLTLDVIKRINPGEIVWDRKVTGFGVRRQRSEARTYIVKAKVKGRSRWFTIGRHGAPWTPETARTEAKRILGDIAKGQDLAAIRDEDKAALTVSELCKEYLEQCEAGKILTKFGEPKKASTIDTDRGRINRHIKPLLGKKRVKDVIQQDVKRFLNDVATGKTAGDFGKGKVHGRSVVTGGRGTATRTVGLLGGIFSYAVDSGMLADNPVKGVNRWKDTKEEGYLSVSDFAKLGEALRDAEADGENVYGIAGIRLLMFTGCRKSEILELKWEHVDFEGSCLRLPTSKTGKKVVVLGAPALDILSALPRVEKNPYVLPGKAKGRHLVGLPKIWERIRERAGLDWATLHILRHSFATFGAGAGLGLPIIGKLLGHKDAATTQRYAKVDMDPAKVAADRISKGIAAALAPKEGAEVIALRKA